jgi:PhoPQ-activated pathogenicity-related protein
MFSTKVYRVAFVTLFFLPCLPVLRGGETALDRYVHKPDPTYSWKLVKETKGNPATKYVLDLKSQAWRTEADVDRKVWQHWLTIIKPEKATSDIAFLFITGGKNSDKPPEKADALMVKIAEATQGVVAELKMVPNEPLVFHKDGVGRVEDDLIAYTWDQYLKTGDDTWPARLPMTKSAVRAMDAVQEFLASDQGGHYKVNKFVVSGGSKRGWTSWCTAAVDPRVTAVVPFVIDILNVQPSMRHHAEAYGFYSEAVGDYMKHNIMQRSGDPKLKDLYAIEDPYSYRDRLTMPKFVVNSAGDQFFCPDSSQFYYGDLKGEKYLRYVPNSDHSLKDTDALDSVIAFYSTVMTGKPRPQYSWSFDPDGSIRVTTPDHPKRVVLWTAENPAARDFRLESIGKAYKSVELTDQGGGVYVGKPAPVAKGWTASFVELTFDVGAPTPLKLTSAVRIVPDQLPYAGADPSKVRYEGPKEHKKK